MCLCIVSASSVSKQISDTSFPPGVKMMICIRTRYHDNKQSDLSFRFTAGIFKSFSLSSLRSDFSVIYRKLLPVRFHVVMQLMLLSKRETTCDLLCWVTRWGFQVWWSSTVYCKCPVEWFMVQTEHIVTQCALKLNRLILTQQTHRLKTSESRTMRHWWGASKDRKCIYRGGLQNKAGNAKSWLTCISQHI